MSWPRAVFAQQFFTASAYESAPATVSPPRATESTTSGRNREDATSCASSRVAAPNWDHVRTSRSSTPPTPNQILPVLGLG